MRWADCSPRPPISAGRVASRRACSTNDLALGKKFSLISVFLSNPHGSATLPGLGLACALGPRRTVAKRSEKENKMLRQNCCAAEKHADLTICHLNFGKPFATPAPLQVGGPSYFVIEYGDMRMFRMHGISQWLQLCSKRATQVSATITGRFLYSLSVTRSWATRDGQLVCLALHWAKAFDSVDLAALVFALQQFGIPNNICRIVQAIYANRTFQVRDSGTVSSVKGQLSGISQGCPLSPFLFPCVMTILLHDAAAEHEE